MAKATALPYGPGETPAPYDVGLRFTGGGSDKVYRLSIEPAGDGWTVNYANGRYGGTMATGTKTTKGPVDWETAAKLCAAQLSEKVSKGYLPTTGSRLGEGATFEAIATAERKSSGHVPQLSNPIDDDELEHYLRDDAYAAQQKHDGERRILIVKDGVATAGNRKGQTVPVTRGIAEDAAGMGVDAVLDGEQVGETFHAFDLLERDGKDLRGLPMRERVRMLGDLAPGAHVKVTETAFTEGEKRAFLLRAKSLRHEGLVFKRASAPYASGRPNSGGDSMKYKFFRSLSAVVSAVNAKRSVALSLRDEDGSPLPVGNVTVPANRPVPSEGDVVEVRYLYAFDGGSLFQPTFEGVRTDVTPEECLASQRVMKEDVEASLAMAP